MSEATEPVTAQRLRELATSRGSYVRDLPDGVVLQQDGRAHELVVTGGVVVIRSLWPRTLPAGARKAAAQLVNDWNRDRIIPSLHTRKGEQGIGIVASCAVPVGPGMSDAQLDELLDVSLSATGQAMQTLTASTA